MIELTIEQHQQHIAMHRRRLQIAQGNEVFRLNDLCAYHRREIRRKQKLKENKNA